jgi:hypothetical protein
VDHPDHRAGARHRDHDRRDGQAALTTRTAP